MRRALRLSLLAVALGAATWLLRATLTTQAPAARLVAGAASASHATDADSTPPRRTARRDERLLGGVVVPGVATGETLELGEHHVRWRLASQDEELRDTSGPILLADQVAEQRFSVRPDPAALAEARRRSTEDD
jgi:hypothetical protein